MSPRPPGCLLGSRIATTPGMRAPLATRCSGAKGRVWRRLSVLCPTRGSTGVGSGRFAGALAAGGESIRAVSRSGSLSAGGSASPRPRVSSGGFAMRLSERWSWWSRCALPTIRRRCWPRGGGVVRDDGGAASSSKTWPLLTGRVAQPAREGTEGPPCLGQHAAANRTSTARQAATHILEAVGRGRVWREDGHSCAAGGTGAGSSSPPNGSRPPASRCERAITARPSVSH